MEGFDEHIDARLDTSLSQHFGFSSFRSGQRETITHLLKGQSAIAIFPTGSGKSLCYQLPALLLPNLTLVVSPLLALMQDQVAFLRSKGIAAASIESSQSKAEQQHIMAQIQSGELKILMVSVERLKNERFRQWIANIPISMLVVDEAHCISEWGHNFRPDYIKLPFYQQQLQIPQVLLLTATATKKVQMDMAQRFAIAPNNIIQTGFYRPNLHLSVVPKSPEEKMPYLVKALSKKPGASIVYVSLQQQAEDVAKQLQAAGLKAKAYHAGMDDTTRQAVQAAFMADELDVVVATIAFGMGVDKSNIRFVIHYELPKSLENYAQEIGRAGRDGKQSYCVVLGSLDGLNTLENFIYGDTPEAQSIENLLSLIAKEVDNDNQWHVVDSRVSTETDIKQLVLKTLLVQLELRGVLAAQYAFYAQMRFKLLVTEKQLFSHFDESRQTTLKTILRFSEMKRNWATIDVDGLFNQGQIDNGKLLTIMEYLQQKGLVEFESKVLTQVYRVDKRALAEHALLGELTNYFQEKEKAEIKRIQTMLRFFQSSRCLSQNLCDYFSDARGPNHCGHCSVCHRKVATFEQYEQAPWPSDEVLREAIFRMNKHLAQAGEKASPRLRTRFLSGLLTPKMSRFKLRQMPGFGSCEKQRFADIEATLKRLGIFGIIEES
ncbi:RecQ family ATP-dependent DNA helicase (plasmid) [Pseudoalteromonas xiamenensis]|uniref:RecQ family ATP-dependent DNA helicase n=1 Tax=Pseudoalteromonas xiamenensis TaxID=882626 RepID=UPI0027E41081|nr:ATP-dependent DNA helicase RecQ [Pseudoalteromonas xiamenensis]WMN61770.1 RecQ family ATP-dependent DNA helicase [Pseudoalteromonas xiamenensis]